jgi:hypothetical protein
LSRLSVYPELLKRLTNGQLLVDIGCFIGHDLRHLVHDGAPSENLHGIDIADFWDLGFEMYNDRGHFNAKFTKADFLSSDAAMAEFRDKCDIISIFQVSVDITVLKFEASQANKLPSQQGPTPMELERPSRSLQNTGRLLQARLSSRRQSDW